MKRIKDELNEMQKEAVNLILQGKNVFISGAGGTGKSFIIKALARNPLLKVVVAAPTGTAASLIGGVTLHSLLKLPIGVVGPNFKPSEKNPVLDACNTIVVDEISMVRFDLFSFMLKSIRASEARTGVRKSIVLLGDFYQLPPVITSRDREALTKLYGFCGSGYAFKAASWGEVNPFFVELTEQMRQNSSEEEFVNALDDIRHGCIKTLSFFDRCVVDSEECIGTLLSAKRKEVEKVNLEKLEALDGGEVREYHAIVEGEFDTREAIAECHLKLKVGAPVLILVNDYAGDAYSNGTRATVVAMEADSVTVVLESGLEVKLDYYEWQQYSYIVDEETNDLKKVVVGSMRMIPVNLAYAITIHKAQGMTLSNITVCVDSIWASGMLYTALSRVKSIHDLHLKSPIKPKMVKVDKEVEAFYRWYRNSSLYERIS